MTRYLFSTCITLIVSAPFVCGSESDGVESLKKARILFHSSKRDVKLIEAQMENAIKNGQYDSVLEYHLGMMTFSKKWMKIASDNGHPIAKFYYANLLEIDGADQGELFNLYLSSAECGIPSAEEKVGWHYENGKGVTIDYQKAINWYKKAASHGINIAYYRMARCYLSLGDKIEYKKLLDIAANLGVAKAKVEIAKIILDENEPQIIDSGSLNGWLPKKLRAYRLCYPVALQGDEDAMVIVGKILMEGIQGYVSKDEILGGAFLILSGRPNDYQIVIARFPSGSSERKEVMHGVISIGRVSSSYPKTPEIDMHFDRIDQKYLKVGN